MSKRFIFPQQHGERKKAKLDVTITDHNFPLSQNTGSIIVPDRVDTWGDDNDDEILLLASQACEDAYKDISTLPDYSLCMQPSSTSTQMLDSIPSTSQTPFAFKKPNSIPPNVISTNLKDKCSRISSPLPDMYSKVVPKANGNVNLSDDLIFNDKIYKGQDSDYIYRQLLQLQEENVKLKSDNGKLLEKCVTKEGEASILRTQLKTSQIAVDNARLDRIKAQEKVQMEWTDKLSVASSQMHDLRTQLDFKNLEIISIKERCRMLESNKVKLTQVTVPNNDISSSHRNSSKALNESFQAKRLKLVSSSVQTEDQAHFLKLNKTCRSEPPHLAAMLPLTLAPTPDQPALTELSDKLQRHAHRNRCRVYSTFHCVSAGGGGARRALGASPGAVYAALTALATGAPHARDHYYTIFSNVASSLAETTSQLELISRHVTTAFLREMDERYMEASNTCLEVEERDLLSGSPLYKDEQAILARRMTAILNCVLQTAKSKDIFNQYEDHSNSEVRGKLFDIISRICCLLDSTSCALLHSGLLLSLTNLLTTLATTAPSLEAKTMAVIKCIISSRPMPFVSCQVLAAVRRLSVVEGFMRCFCPGGAAGNLKVDYDQGVLLYKKDSCYLQVLLKQVEGALRCVERRGLPARAAAAARDLVALYANVNCGRDSVDHDKSRCDCHLIMLQVIVYALRICAVLLKNASTLAADRGGLLSACRSGLQLLHRSALRDAELGARLAHAEGHLIHYCDLMAGFHHAPPYETMLTELSSIFQCSPDDMTSSFHRQALVNSFKSFSMTD